MVIKNIIYVEQIIKIMYLKKKDVIPNNIDLVKIDIKKKYSENKVNEIYFKEVNNSYNMNEVIQLKDKRLKRNMINKNKLKQKHKIYKWI